MVCEWSLELSDVVALGEGGMAGMLMPVFSIDFNLLPRLSLLRGSRGSENGYLATREANI